MAAMAQRTDDLDRIMTVMREAFDPAFREAWTRRQVEDALLIGNCHYLLAGPDGQELPQHGGEETPTTGFTLSRCTFEEEELLLIGVMPQYRRCGIASKLLLRLAENACRRGAQRLILEMRRANPAEALYRNHGFEPVGVRPNYYRTLAGDTIDAITFARFLV